MYAPVTDGPVRLAVIGGPGIEERSLSPAMFAAAFAHAGIDGRYGAVGAADDAAFAAVVARLAREGFRGANVTMPFKPAAARLASIHSDAVLRGGIANTLRFARDGVVRADATDGAGMLAAITARGVELQGVRALLLGAGGVGADAAHVLAAAGVGSLTIVNRTVDRAVELRDRLRAAHPELLLEVSGQLPITASAHVLVSCVPEPAVPASLLASLAQDMTVIDFAYRADRQPTDLIKAAQGHGAERIDGGELLARQGALAFSLWFGVEAPTEVMVRAVR